MLIVVALLPTAMGGKEAATRIRNLPLNLSQPRPQTPWKAPRNDEAVVWQARRDMLPGDFFDPFVRDFILPAKFHRLNRPQLAELPDGMPAFDLHPGLWGYIPPLCRDAFSSQAAGIARFARHPRLRALVLRSYGNLNLRGAEQLTQLEFLDLGNCRLLNFNDSPIPSLRRLSLGDAVPADRTPFRFSERWSNLESLLLGNAHNRCPVDTASLRRLPNLRELIWIGQPPGDLEWLYALPRLETIRLDFGNNRLRLDLARLADQPLRTLHIAPSLWPAEPLDPLYRMTRLEELTLRIPSRAKLDTDRLGRLPLRELTLYGSPRQAGLAATDAAALGRLPLKRLALAGLRFPALPELVRRLPELEAFRCVRAEPLDGDDLIKQLAALPRLRYLSLAETAPQAPRLDVMPHGPGRPLDLSPLRKLPLVALDLSGVNRPVPLGWIRECPTLRYLRLPPQTVSLEALSGLTFDVLLSSGSLADVPAECARWRIARRHPWARLSPVPGAHPAWRNRPPWPRPPRGSTLKLPAMPRLPRPAEPGSE